MSGHSIPSRGRGRPLCASSRFRCELFLRANEASPVVYGSVDDEGHCTYRLANGKMFELTSEDCRRIGHPRWSHIPQESAA